jgi:hypothetical protein
MQPPKLSTLLTSLMGMRSGEIFGLVDRDIERRGKDECLVTIRAETSKVRKGRQIAVANEMLVLWLTKFQRHRDPDDYVYSSYNDGGSSIRDVFYHAYGSLRVRLREIDLDWFDLYHCRHWYITNRLLAEEAIYSVVQATGTSLKEIEDTYSHVRTELKGRLGCQWELQGHPETGKCVKDDMFDQMFRNIDNVLRREVGCQNELDYIEQPSWITFLEVPR